jgi:hypothetical protein
VLQEYELAPEAVSVADVPLQIGLLPLLLMLMLGTGVIKIVVSAPPVQVPMLPITV